jgi:gamma-glutamylcyclotransferase (GGCT)/AIG2-like uncharacterized protein YtfP
MCASLWSSPALSSHHVFVYGSLVQPGTLDDVLGHRHSGERLAARLEDFSRITLDTYPYPFIVAKPGSRVDGVLLMDLSADDLQALDRYEEVETLAYLRERVEVEAWGCGPRPARIEAYTYVGGPGLIAAATA